jgi:hypothetical protein
VVKAEIVPLTLAEARRYVASHHRHNEPPIAMPTYDVFPYDDGYDATGAPDFGYVERWCAGPLGHTGNHSDNPDSFTAPPSQGPTG